MNNTIAKDQFKIFSIFFIHKVNFYKNRLIELIWEVIWIHSYLW